MTVLALMTVTVSMAGPGARPANGAGGPPAGTGTQSPLLSATTVPTGGLRPRGDGARVTQVSCPSDNYCVGFGDYGDPSGGGHGFIATLAGGTWAGITAPTEGLVPPPATTEMDFLPSGVRCPALGWCVAVGSYDDSSHHLYGLIETLSHDRWRALTAPTRGLRPAPGNDPEVTFSAVRCPAPGQCLALGAYEDGAHQVHSFVERLSGGRWTAFMPSTAGLEPAAAPKPDVRLDDLSCPVGGHCVVMGRYVAATGVSEGLAETISGDRQAARTLPLTGLAPAAGKDPSPALYGLACASRSECTAVGSYQDAFGDMHGLAETMSRGAWAATTLPEAALQPIVVGEQLSPDELACPSARYCVAIGTYRGSSGGTEGFAETYSGTKWSAATLPATSLAPAVGPNGVLALDSLACPSVGHCVAVGYYADIYNQSHGVIEELSDGTWDAVTAPVAGLDPPAGAYPGVRVYDIVCSPPGGCVAVGTYTDYSGNNQALVANLSP